MCTYLDKTGSTYYFRRPVPHDLIGHFRTKTGQARTEWKFSLRTKDREDAKRLLRPHTMDTDRLIDEARAATAVAGKAAERVLATYPFTQEQADWEAEQDRLRSEFDWEMDARDEAADALEARLDLPEAELSTDEVPAARLYRRVRRERDAYRDRYIVRKRRDGHRDSPLVGQSSPALVLPADSASSQSKPKVGITALYERYAASGAANPKTVTKWRRCVGNLVAFLGHEDACAVTRADINRWVDNLVAAGLAKKTISGGYLPPVQLTFSLAHDDGTIPANPASGIKVRAPKAHKLHDRDMSDDEAKTILRASLGPQPAKLDPVHALARRWVPWLCAYTGARVAEITQLRAMDIRKEQGIWVLHITPEAGSVKTDEARLVPLHPHLIEQGFINLAKADDELPLFHKVGVGNAVNPASKIRAADLAEWVRGLGVKVPQPNHGWRHRFKTVSRDVGISEAAAEYIQGHKSANQGRKYGRHNLPTILAEIEKLPRYEA